MFDYSNEIDSGSKVWLHESELNRIHRGIFTRRRFREELGLPHRRKHEQAVAPGHWKEDDRRLRQDRLFADARPTVGFRNSAPAHVGADEVLRPEGEN